MVTEVMRVISTPRGPRHTLGGLGVVLLVISLYWLLPVYWRLPGGMALGIVMMVAACVVLAAGIRASAVLSAVGVLSIVAVCLASDLLLQHIEAHFQPVLHWFNLLPSLLFGERAYASSDGTLHLLVRDNGFAVRPSFAITQVRTFLVFILGLWVYAAWSNVPTRRLVVPIIVISIGCSIRYAVLVSVFIGKGDNLGDLSHPWVALCLMPASVAVVLYAGLLTLNWTNFTKVSMYFWPMRAIGLLGSAVLVGMGMYWEEPGVQKAGRILIDDQLSAYWEPSLPPLTESAFGDFSTYSFSACAEDLSRHYTVSVRKSGRLDANALRDVDVLILKTMQTGLSTEETASVHAWVEQGGGLFVISDHTNLSGMTTNANAVLRPYGLFFRSDATSAPQSPGGFEHWSPRPGPRHSVGVGLGAVDFMNGCSISMSWGARPVLAASQCVSVAGDYSKPSNFAERGTSPEDLQGLVTLAACRTYGAGRVFAFGDSTVCSSFAYYRDNHQHLIRRAVAWLNRANSWLGWGGLFCMFIGLLLVALTILVTPVAHMQSYGATCIAVGLLCGATIPGRLVSTAITTAEWSSSDARVCIVADGSHAALPPVLGNQPSLPSEQLFGTFGVIPIRLGLEPEVLSHWPGNVDNVNHIVVLNAAPAVEDSLLGRLDSWLQRGGRLTYLVPAQARRPELLERVAIGRQWQMRPGYTPLVIEECLIGTGTICCIYGSEAFSSSNLGHCMEYPTPRQLTWYQAAYDIFSGFTASPLPRHLPVVWQGAAVSKTLTPR